jgi:hypothetical protein
MKNKVSIAVVLLLSTSFLNTAMAQTGNNDSFTVVGGKWIVCADTTLKKNYDCQAPYTGFEFLSNGTYREYPKAISDPSKSYLAGKWTLNKNEFTIDQYDEPGTMELPKTYMVVWTDKDHFYASNKDGKAGLPMYVYYQRIK